MDLLRTALANRFTQRSDSGPLQRIPPNRVLTLDRSDIVEKSKILILLAADGTPKMAKTLLPFIDWDDPANLHITVNTGGVGGIGGHELYMSDDLRKVCQVLKKYIQEGKSVYIPTNQKERALQLAKLCRVCFGLSDDEVMVYERDSPKKLKREIIEDKDSGAWRLGYTAGSPYTKIRVFIATPAFGVGFSIKGDLFDVTIAFFFTYPLTVPGNIQHIARVRGVKEKIIICYYQSRLSMQKTFKRKNMMCNERAKLRDAIMSYEDLIANVNMDEFERVPEGQLRSFAIECELRDRQSKWNADIMFLDEVTKSTQTPAYLLQSWECGKGAGPIVVLPDITDQEYELVRDKVNPVAANADLPTTWSVMEDLWVRQASGDKRSADLSTEEVEFLKLFEELPIPYGLLEDHERCEAFVGRLDHLWRVMEVVSFEDSARLLQIDYKKYNLSQGVTTVPQKERYYQQYQLFEAWSRLILPCLPYQYQAAVGSDAGIKLISFLTETWRGSRGISDDQYSFDLNPDVGDIERAIENIRRQLELLRERDAAVDEWIDAGELKGLEKYDEEEGGFLKAYAKIVRRGFRQLLGKSNASIKSQKKIESVRVKITKLKRLMLLACARRVNLDCKAIIAFDRKMFVSLVKYRACPHLVGLIPSDDELAQACALDL